MWSQQQWRYELFPTSNEERTIFAAASTISTLLVKSNYFNGTLLGPAEGTQRSHQCHYTDKKLGRLNCQPKRMKPKQRWTISTKIFSKVVQDLKIAKHDNFSGNVLRKC